MAAGGHDPRRGHDDDVAPGARRPRRTAAPRRPGNLRPGGAGVPAAVGPGSDGGAGRVVAARAARARRRAIYAAFRRTSRRGCRSRRSSAAGDAGGNFDPETVPGSNNFALAGARVAGGGAMVANDMHLGLMVPNTWYRAVARPAGADGHGRHAAGRAGGGRRQQRRRGLGVHRRLHRHQRCGHRRDRPRRPDALPRARRRRLGTVRDRPRDHPPWPGGGRRRWKSSRRAGGRCSRRRDAPGAPLALRWVAARARRGQTWSCAAWSTPARWTRRVEHRAPHGRAGGEFRRRRPRGEHRLDDHRAGAAPGRLRRADAPKLGRRHAPLGRFARRRRTSPSCATRPTASSGRPTTAWSAATPSRGWATAATTTRPAPRKSATVSARWPDAPPRPPTAWPCNSTTSRCFLVRWRDLLLGTFTDDAVDSQPPLAELREAVRDWHGHAAIDEAGPPAGARVPPDRDGNA